MIKYGALFLCAVITWNSCVLADFRTITPSVCVLTDAPKQCGSFCLAALHPLFDGLENLRKQLNTTSRIQNDMQAMLVSNQKDIKDMLANNSNRSPDKPTNIENKLPMQQCFVRKHFTIINIEKTWDDAETYCRVMGGHLATFKNQEEFDSIKEQIDPSENYWVGINDRVKENEYVSVTFGQKVQFLDWGLGEPSDPGKKEDCVELKELKMNDID